MKINFSKYKRIVPMGLLVFMLAIAGLNMMNTNAVEGEPNKTPFTKIDEEGNVTFMTEEELNASGIVKTSSGKQRSAERAFNPSEGIVNFRTKSSKNETTSYIDTATNRSAPTNGFYAADAAYLGHSSDGKVLFMLGGVIGKVAESEVQLLNYSDANVETLSKYYVSNGTLYHGIVTNLNDSGYSSSINVGAKPSYLNEGGKYFSYDGHYFYTDTGNKSGYVKMINDYKNDSRANSVNPNYPYYNYYQYLSLRSTSVLTANQFNERVVGIKGSGKSIIESSGNLFLEAQRTYGINAGNMFGLACNESAYGTSDIAKTKNNLFGLNAVDSSPGTSASTYGSVEACINDFAYGWMSKGYLNGTDWRYCGPHFGDKNSGINVQYASDPYWGEKAAAQNYSVDTAGKDYGRYSIGIAKYGKISVYKEATTSSTILYTTDAKNGNKIFDYPVTIIGTVTASDGSKWHKVQSDMPLNSSRTARDVKAKYDYARDYAYVRASDIYITLNSNGNGGDYIPTKPSYLKGDVNGDEKVSSLDYMQIKNHIMGSSYLSDTTLARADINSDGKISSLDYMQIKNHIMGTNPLF